jgi:hypothetical protein
VKLFRSVAHYWEPAGPVSWDVALSATKPDWRVKVRKGDIVKVTGTHDVSRASWWESMAIMFVERYLGTDVGGVDPFAGHLDTAGLLTHGPCPRTTTTVAAGRSCPTCARCSAAALTARSRSAGSWPPGAI